MIDHTSVQTLPRPASGSWGAPRPSPQAPAEAGASTAPGPAAPPVADPTLAVATVDLALRLTGPLDAGRLLGALAAFARRHPGLRATFGTTWESSGPRVRDGWSPRVRRVDLGELPPDEQARRLTEVFADQRARPFEPGRLPLARFTLVRLADDRHVLTVSVARLVADDVSLLDVLPRELLALYVGPGEGQGLPAAPALGLVAQAAAARRLEPAAPAPTPLELPSEPSLRARPPHAGPRGETGDVLLRLDAERVAPLRALAERFETTLDVVLLAGWAALLHRHTRAPSLVVAVETTGRHRPTLADAFAGLAHDRAWTADLSADPSFVELVRQAADAEDGPRAGPGLQLGFSHREPRGRRHFAAGLLVEVEGPATRTGPLELALRTEDLGSGPDGGLTLRLEHRLASLDAGAARRLGQRLLRLLESAAEEPRTAVSRLALLDPAERHEVIEGWNRTAGPVPVSVRLHELFEAQAAQRPEAVAVLCKGQRLTYAELDRRANRIARALVQAGVTRGALVGACLERDLDAVAGLLGIFKAGAAYVPLDPAYPEDRLRFMLEDTAAAVVLTSRAVAARVPATQARALLVDGPEVEAQEGAPLAAGGDGSLDDVAYVIYTSGSTGRPKGVVVRHRPAINLTDWVSTTFGVGPSDRLLWVTSMSFDLSVYDLFGVLGAGGSIHVATQDELKDPARLVELLASGEVTIWDSAPPALLQLAPFFPGKSEKSKLRLAMLSGDWIPVPLPDRVRRAFPTCKVVSLGGATEATVWSNVYEVGEVDPSWPSIPYGVPIRNARYYVLDKHLEPVPPGVTGDLWIGGECLADGYLNRPELNAERFVADPFVPGGRMYRTGDLARHFTCGNLQFLGRVDHQVKVRGYRIELGEVEAALQAQPGVETAKVLARKDHGGEQALAAYLVLRPGHRFDEAALRAGLARSLPAPMIPAFLVPLAALPVTPNGKLDRDALPDPLAVAREATREHVAPVGVDEEALAGLFAEALGVLRVGRTDDFLRLGGHSLLAARVAARVRDRLGVDVRPVELLEARTVEACARLVDDRRRAPADGRIPAVAPDADVELSPAQELFWIQGELSGDSTAYVVPFAVRLPGGFDPAALRAAVDAVVQRHDALRTTIAPPASPGAPARLVVAPTLSVPLPMEDLSAAPDPAEAARARLAALSQQPFDRAGGPLVRAAVWKTGPDAWLLGLALDHIISDGWSVGVLARDLGVAYREARERGAANLPPLAASFRDCAAWLRARLDAERTERLSAYWRERLRDLPPALTLAPDAGLAARGSATVERALDPDVAAAVRELARAEGSTPAAVLLGAYLLVLHRWTGREDLVVGMPVAGRDRNELQELVGCFVGPVPLRVSLDASTSFRDLLARTGEALLGSLTHAELPARQLAECAGRHGGEPLFRLFFNVIGDELTSAKDGLEVALQGELLHKFDLTLYVVEGAEGALSLRLCHDAGRYTAERMAELAAQLERALTRVTREPTTAAGQVALAGEGAALPDPRAALDPTGGEPIPAAFLRQAERAPERLAVTGPTLSWSYGGLRARADGLAAALRDGGLRPGGLVALWAARDPALVVALLGVLEAGGRFVVLDPDHPPSHSLRVLEVAGPDAWVALGRARPVPAEVAALVEAIPLRLTLTDDLPAPRADALPPLPLEPDGPAYVAFTSGTTGRPKGVEGDHRAVAHYVAWETGRFDVTSDDRVALLSGLSHDPLLRDVFVPLAAGASIHVPEPDGRSRPRWLLEWLARERVTIVHATPGLLSLLADVQGEEGALVDLRLIFSGGDRLRGRDVERIRRLAPNARLVSLYGTTETPQGMGWHEVEGALAPDAVAPLGRGIDDVQLLVVRQDGGPCGPYELGEVVVRTPYLARGYLREPELTRARFVQTPGATASWDRSYRTGDLGWSRADGVVVLVGRADRQVKVRGVRVELGEVEAALLRHPQVARAAVVARPGPDGEVRLEAFVELSGPPERSLRQHLAAECPPGFAPAVVEVLERLPLTPNGKVDLARLPAAGPPRSEAGAASLRPRTQTEQLVCDLWAELLGLPQVGVTDDFFTIGGHSLLALRMLDLLGRKVGAVLPVAMLLRAPTPAQLAEQLHRGAWCREEDRVIEFQRGDPGRPPLWLFPPIGGHVLFADRLAERLGAGQPVIGIQSRGLDGRSSPIEGVPAIAADCLRLIRERQPVGPYYLAGPSFGGVVAYEVARQLRAQGEEIGLLALIDSFAPRGDRSLVARVPELARRLWAGVGRARALDGWGARARYAAEAAGRLLSPAPKRVGRYDAHRRAVRDGLLVEAVERVVASNYASAATYEARPYAGPALLLRATRRSPDLVGASLATGDPATLWRRLVRDLTVVDIDATHQTIVDEPAVQDVARALGTSIADSLRTPRADAA